MDRVKVMTGGGHHPLAIKVNKEFPGLKLVPLRYQSIIVELSDITLIDGDDVPFDCGIILGPDFVKVSPMLDIRDFGQGYQ